MFKISFVSRDPTFSLFWNSIALKTDLSKGKQTFLVIRGILYIKVPNNCSQRKSCFTSLTLEYPFFLWSFPFISCSSESPEILSWTVQICLVSLEFTAKAAPQESHEKGFFLSWTDTSCIHSKYSKDPFLRITVLTNVTFEWLLSFMNMNLRRPHWFAVVVKSKEALFDYYLGGRTRL